MSQSESAVLAYWGEHRDQLRQSETQRALLTNYLLVIAAALSALVVQQRFVAETLPLSVLIALVGVYGAISVAKYHERAEYHLTQARALTRVLKDMGALADQDTLDEFRERHYARYPRLHRVRLHALWTGLHVGIFVYGLTLVIITLAR
ncbi:hypothetical protein ACFY36_08205 [Actinoplanes sp. NPDC000266]